MTNHSTLLTVAQAADRVGLGRSMIYRLMAAGDLEKVKIGRSTRIPDDSVESYIRSLRTGTRERDR